MGKSFKTFEDKFVFKKNVKMPKNRGSQAGPKDCQLEGPRLLVILNKISVYNTKICNDFFGSEMTPPLGFFTKIAIRHLLTHPAKSHYI